MKNVNRDLISETCDIILDMQKEFDNITTIAIRKPSVKIIKVEDKMKKGNNKGKKKE